MLTVDMNRTLKGSQGQTTSCHCWSTPAKRRTHPDDEEVSTPIVKLAVSIRSITFGLGEPTAVL